MKLADMDLFDECFTHVDDETGVQTTYNVKRLFEYVVAHEAEVEQVSVPVEAYHAKYCMENRGVEQDRLRALMETPEYLKKPIIFIHLPDDSHLLADGTHRYVLYFLAGQATIPAYMVPWAVAAPFVVEDAPQTTEEALMAWSGLSLLRKLREE